MEKNHRTCIRHTVQVSVQMLHYTLFFLFEVKIQKYLIDTKILLHLFTISALSKQQPVWIHSSKHFKSQIRVSRKSLRSMQLFHIWLQFIQQMAIVLSLAQVALILHQNQAVAIHRAVQIHRTREVLPKFQ